MEKTDSWFRGWREPSVLDGEAGEGETPRRLTPKFLELPFLRKGRLEEEGWRGNLWGEGEGPVWAAFTLFPL